MLSLPKVKKGLKNAGIGVKKVQKVVAGVALALGIGVAALPSQAAQIPVGQMAHQQLSVNEGALVLSPPASQVTQLAQHGSHYSHSSHVSHHSHHSHYSSRY